MCFHSKQSKDAQTIEKRFKAKFVSPELYKPTLHYNAFEFPKTPVITKQNTDIIEMISWGLIPEWADEDWNRTYTLNARIETLEEKPAFRDYIENRCVIPVNAFYEWQHRGKQKVKYEIGFDDALFVLAGLYTHYNDSKTYTVLTTEAAGIMRDIHNSKLRMPVALRSDAEIEEWLKQGLVKPRQDFTATRLDPEQLDLFS